MAKEKKGNQEGKPGGERQATPAAFLLLTLLSLIAFANSFPNSFAFDDQWAIVKNRLIKRLDQLPTLFTTEYWAGAREEEDQPGPRDVLYRPLVTTTYALNYAVGGVNPFGYHLVNLLLHLAVCFLLYRLARRLGYSFGAALAASALFAVHPLHTEAVTGIVGRSESLMSLGLLLALRGSLTGGAQDRPLRTTLASLGAFLVALLSKEQAMVLPALLVLADLALTAPQEPARGPGGEGRAMSRGVFRRYGGYILILGVYLALRTAVLGGFYRAPQQIPFVDNPLARAPWVPRVLTALKVAGMYLWLFVWPAKLSADYSYNAIPMSLSLLEPAVLLALLAWGGLLGLAVFSYLWGRRLTFFAVGFTVLTFLPASNLLIPIGTIMGERLFYLPSAGLCLLLGRGWDRVLGGGHASPHPQDPRPHRVGVGVFALVLVLLTARTIHRNRDWRNNETLFQSAVQVVPHSAKAHANLGMVKQQQLKLAEALHEYEEAIRIYPQYPARHPMLAKKLGAVLLHEGRIEEAIDMLKRAVQAWPKDADAHYNLGLAYAKQERYEEAEAAYRRALVLKLDDPDTHNSLSFVLRKQGRFAEALAAADEAIRLKPSFAEAHYNRARALEALGRLAEAKAASERALALKPELPAAKRQLDQLRRRMPIDKDEPHPSEGGPFPRE